MISKKTYKELKELSDMTQAALSEFHGVSERTIRYWLSGDSHRVPKDSYEKLENYVLKLTLKGMDNLKCTKNH